MEIAVAVSRPTGSGARTPRVLLNETAHRLDGWPLDAFAQDATYDTYDGQNDADGPDWYAITFPDDVAFDCLEMTMGFPYRDGGWWTSLAVEVRAGDGGGGGGDGRGWRRVDTLAITPPYACDDARLDRRPFETHILTFDAVTARSVRVIGRPGGLARFTSLARLAVYRRDPPRRTRPPMNAAAAGAAAADGPVPHLFRLVPPGTVWDMSVNLATLTGLTIGFPLMEYYLDAERWRQYNLRTARNYRGEPDLWFLVGNVLGWHEWNRVTAATIAEEDRTALAPHVHTSLHETLARAVAPVVVDGQTLGAMVTNDAVVTDHLDWEWHRRFARDHAIPWHAYRAAIERSPRLTWAQMEAAAALMGTIANTIANLVHHLDRAQEVVDRRSRERRDLARRAVDYMRDNVETPTTVAEVAHELGLSLSYFSTLFAEQVGRSPRDYLIDLRLERARAYLEDEGRPVKDICMALGYDVSYFIRLFKARVGCTPGQYARRGRRG